MTRRVMGAILGFAVGTIVCAAAAQPTVFDGASRSTAEIAELIEAASPGDTITLKPGTYHGNLVVNKRITLTGEPGVVIDGDGQGTVVTVEAQGVTIRGLTIRGSESTVGREASGIHVVAGGAVIENNTLEDVYFGIDLKEARGSIIRHNTITGKDLAPGRRGDGIRLWWSHESVVEFNTVRSARDMVFWYSEDLVIRENNIEGCRYGLHFMYSHNTVLSKNTLKRNSVGIYLMYSNGITIEDNVITENRGASGYAVGLKDCTDVRVRRNQMLANRVGLYTDNTPSTIDGFGEIFDNAIAFNELGMIITPNTKNLSVVGNGFVENEEQVGVHGRGDLVGNAFADEARGNFWSDYAGFDQDGDGIGDLPHKSVSLFETLLAREPNLRLFIHSPAQQAIEFTAKALPEVRPEPKLVDPFPLMVGPSLQATPVTASMRAGTMLAAILLIGLGLGTLVFGGAARGLPETARHQAKGILA